MSHWVHQAQTSSQWKLTWQKPENICKKNGEKKLCTRRQCKYLFKNTHVMLTAGHLHILIANFFHNLAAIFTPVGCSKATSLHCFQNILTT